MPNTQTVDVPHLGGITAAYQTAGPIIDSSKPTLVLVNSFTTSSELYRDFFANKDLRSVMNLLAIELLGHGQTRVHKTGHWTYWDTASMNLQVMEKLGIKEAFVLGTSQGGWITARMALLAPEKIKGIIPLGTSFDYESERSRSLGCWKSLEPLQATIAGFSSPSDDSFVPGDDFSNFLIDVGMGTDCPSDIREYWKSEIAKNYAGDEGRKRIRMAAINLRDRDGLHSRLADVVCPVMWLHGTSDVVYSVANAREEIKMFTGSRDAQLKVLEGGQHFLNASHPKEVAESVLGFVKQYS
ncbi:hypothetical protein NX059_008007 [Plenodomus lindquistii]|nr:hypothetical protein NX059_008007 [Plenodomus lindquistii]